MTTKHSDEPSTPPEEPYTRRVQDDESPSIAVVRAVAAMQKTPDGDIDPLANWVDPDALDSLLGRGDEVTVEFEYVGMHVTVDGRSVTVQHAAEK